MKSLKSNKSIYTFSILLLISLGNLSFAFSNNDYTSSPDNVDFDTCVRRLYAIGGMSQKEANYFCYNQVSVDLLNCQNHKFLYDFMQPKKALKACQENLNVTSFDQNRIYRGSFEQTPYDQSKKTVCSVTINSKDEREAFRNTLDRDLYNWVELLPHNSEANSNRFIARDTYWLKRACEKQIKCDIMVFSGHFASSFIGDSGFELKLSELTKYSCQNKCNNFFNSVKEVYLFGCNTLANNTPDKRTISQYRELLIQDGVSPHQAQRIAARRYTKYGQTIRDEFRRVFPKAENIYGYSKPSPTGKNVKPYLVKYLNNLNSISEHSKRKLRKNFENTLGRTGMEIVSRLPKDKYSCQQKVQLIRNDQSFYQLENYIKRNGYELPVAAIDLIEEAFDKILIDPFERDILVDSVFKLFKNSTTLFTRHQLCPILATENFSIVPRELNCMGTIGTYTDSKSWANSHY